MKCSVRCGLVVAVLCFFLSCGGEKNFDKKIEFETVECTKSGKEVDADTTKSYEAVILYYKPTNTPKYLTDSINNQNRIFLSNWFDVPETGDFDINKLVLDDIRAFYKQVDNIGDKECFTCRVKQINIKGDSVFQNQQIVSIPYSWYIYEGGAHGNYGKICYNYMKNDGKKIHYKDLVVNEPKLLEVAEKEFKEQNGITEGQNLLDLYQFENNKFYLSDNFSFSPKGIIFYYNPYEIAPYAAGLIELVLTNEQVKGLINFIDSK